MAGNLAELSGRVVAKVGAVTAIQQASKTIPLMPLIPQIYADKPRKVKIQAVTHFVRSCGGTAALGLLCPSALMHVMQFAESRFSYSLRRFEI